MTDEEVYQECERISREIATVGVYASQDQLYDIVMVSRHQQYSIEANRAYGKLMGIEEGRIK